MFAGSPVLFLGGPWDGEVHWWEWPSGRLEWPSWGYYVLDFTGVSASWTRGY